MGIVAAMTQEIKQKIYKETQRNIKRIFKSHLKKFILYGSYARNNEDNESDIDFLVLTDLEEKDIKSIDDKVNRVMCDLSLKYDRVLSFVVLNITHFNKYKAVVPFYDNILKEGIVIYGS